METKHGAARLARFHHRSHRRNPVGASIVIGAAAAVATYFAVVRPWHLKWGATKEEIDRHMPGDDLVEDPTYLTNRAVTINATPDKVWPWLAQFGEGRGGFYSYDWIENLMGMRVHSADHILLEHYNLHKGDIVPAGKEGIPVLDAKENEFLLMGTDQGENWGYCTWCIGLYPTNNGATRVITRVRANVKATPPGILLLSLLDPGQFFMDRKMLLGLKSRVENSLK